MAKTVSAQFIEALCDKLKASLDLNAKLRAGGRQASLDKQMFNMIMDAHISTLTCHTTILEQLLETAETEQQEPAVTELKRAVDRARGVLDDAHMAKSLMTEDENIQHLKKDSVVQIKSSQECKSDKKASNAHCAETTQRPAVDDENERSFGASKRCDQDCEESQRKQEATSGTNSEAATTTPKSKRRLSTSNHEPTSLTPKRRKSAAEALEPTQKRKRDRLSSDSPSLSVISPKKPKPNLPEYERRYLTDEDYDALYPPPQPEVPTEDISEEVDRIIAARQRDEEWQRMRDNGQIEKRKADEDGQLGQSMEEEARMVGKKRRVGEHEQWIESSARAEAREPLLGVENTKNGENDHEANVVGNGIKRGREGQRSEEHSLKRAKTTLGRA